MPIYFDVWAAATPTGTALGELTQAYDKEFQAVDNGLGSGKFTINRHDSQVAWCTPGNFVRARLVAGGPFAYDDARYKAGFILAEGSDVVASVNEQGGEVFTPGGPGFLKYVEEAILAEAALTYPAGPQPDGTWLWTDEQLGSIWRRVIDEAQAGGFLPDMTYDFTDTVDTDGNPWLDIGGPFKLEIGLNLLAIADRLRAQGLRIGMTPALVCQAWQDYESPVRSVTFTVGDGGNIYDVAERVRHASPARSHYLVQGATESGALTYEWAEDPSVETLLGRPKAGFLRYGSTPTPALLQRAGQKQISNLRVQHEGPTTIGVIPRTGEIPFTDYFPGDTVTVDIPGVFDEEAARIASISVVERDADDYDVVIEFGGQSFDPSDPTSATGPLSSPPDDSGIGTDKGGGDDDECCQDPYNPDPPDYSGEVLHQTDDRSDADGYPETRYVTRRTGTPSASDTTGTSVLSVVAKILDQYENPFGSGVTQDYEDETRTFLYHSRVFFTGDPATTHVRLRTRVVARHDSLGPSGASLQPFVNPTTSPVNELNYRIVIGTWTGNPAWDASTANTIAQGALQVHRSADSLTWYDDVDVRVPWTLNEFRFAVLIGTQTLVDAYSGDGSGTFRYESVPRYPGFPGFERSRTAGEYIQLCAPGASAFETTVSYELDWYSGGVVSAPPSSGQPVFDEAINFTGPETSFATQVPHKPGSLIVRVNGVNVTGDIIAQDAATGAFTLSFQVEDDDDLTVDYVAA